MIRFIFLLLLPILLYSKFQVTTHFPLETYIVKQIGQNHIRVKEITNLYTERKIEFKRTKIQSLSRVKAFFYFGFDVELEYAKEFKKINPELLLIDMSKGINKDSFNGKVNHYIWLDPLYMRIVAKNIYDGLVSIDSLNKANFKYNYEKLLLKLDDIFLKTKKNLDDSEIYNIFVYDEYWYYFAKRFRLNLYRKENKYISAEELKNIRNFINKNDIKALLVKPSQSSPIAKSLVGNTQVEIKTHDIFEEIYFFNISKLTKELSDKKEIN